MNKIITYSFCDSFLDRFVDDLDRDYIKQGKDLSRIAIIFGGHRPSLFVKRALAQRIGKAFYPPRFFSIDEFMGYITAKHEAFDAAKELDQCYLMYQLVKEHCAQLLHKRETFAQFLPWVREILLFIEQLDLECVENERLHAVEQNAQIGYDVPSDINDILAEITVLRKAYHEHEIRTGIYTRGFQYRRASQIIEKVSFEEFDEILFANFFYFNQAEEKVVTALYERHQARLFFQGDQRRWPVFKRIARTLHAEITEGETVDQPKFHLKLYRGFDMHSQVCQLREILKTIDDLDKTVVVLPDPDSIIPLLSEVAPVIKDFNISMGYPLKRSSLASLIEQVFKAQNSIDARGYYVHDYLKILKHPLIKNLMLADKVQVTRVLIHKLEEVLIGKVNGSISGCLFLQFDEILECDEIFLQTKETLGSMGIDVHQDELLSILKEIHRYCFRDWEIVKTFHGFANTMNSFLNLLVAKSPLTNYPLNIRITEKIYDIADEFCAASFSGEQFPREDIFHIFLLKMEREIVAFVGTPLKGLQILGLFETRSLNFDHVIMMDINEGVLPRLNIYEALVPRDVKISLNIDRLEQEEEIQRYGFMRLISSAKNVHLLYQENRERERSRFIEELVWQQEKEAKEVDVIPIIESTFCVKTIPRKQEVRKTPEMIEFLKNHCYSASSINTYLRDPMEFYYRYVLGLREQDDLLDEPENKQVGIFLHEVLEDALKGFSGKKPIIDKTFIKYVFGLMDAKFADMFGKSKRSDMFFLKRVIEERMKRFWQMESDRCQRMVKKIIGVEKSFNDVLPLDIGDVKFVYKVDRIDELTDGTILLLDYKTGSADVMPARLIDVERFCSNREEIAETVKSFQLPLYFHCLRKEFPNRQVNAAFYYLRNCQIKEFLGKRTGSDLNKIDEVFLGALNVVMTEIWDPDVPFVESES